jgi:phosphoribosylamine---glycine ligase
MPTTSSPTNKEKKLQIAVVGNGGRESAFIKVLLRDSNVETIHFLKPNAGFQNNPRVKNVAMELHDHTAVVKYCQENHVTLALCGSEELAVIGLNDALKSAGIHVFGASLQAVRIESDKAWARKLMSTLGIPQPQYEVFSDPKKAVAAAKQNESYRIVKAFGLAGGKGVYVCDSLEDTEQAIQEIMVDRKFGDSGSTIVLEERLGWNDSTAEEVSMMFYTDGKTLAALPLAKDHKREFDGDKGKNTGGMGTFSPSPLLNEAEKEFVQTQIAQKIVDQLSKQGNPFTGILYVGLMKTADTSRNEYGIFVIEINGRGGDPETIVQLDSQTNEHSSQIFMACATGELAQYKPKFDDLVHIDVVLCSTAYPEGKTSGEVITGIEEAEKMDVQVVHAGTQMKEGKVVTNGGRILGVVAKGKTLAEARQKVYAAAQHILFDGKSPKYRQDIGLTSLEKNK